MSVPPVYRGFSQTGATDPTDSGSWAVSASLPTGTQVGDALILVVSKWWQRTTGIIAVTDSRFARIQETSYGSVYVGTASTLSPVTVSYSNFPAPSYFNSSNIVIAAFYGPVDDAPTVATLSQGQALVTPAHSRPGGGAGAFAVVLGDWSGFPGINDGVAGYTTITSAGGGARDYQWTGYRLDTGTPPEESPVSATTVDVGGMVSLVGTLWPYTVGAPPCRLFPRGDGLGVGGGRHFPPPKSQQRSGRRFGYY